MYVFQVKSFLRSQGLQEKAVLLLDNAPSHPPADELKSKDGMIFVIFMPPNVTPLIQPLDQNVLRLTKLYYRNSLLSSVVSSDQPIGEALKKLTLKDAMLNLSAAWEKLDPIVIAKCWKNLLEEEKEEDEDNLPLSVLQQKWKEEGVVNDAVRDTVTLLRAIEPVSYCFFKLEKFKVSNSLPIFRLTILTSLQVEYSTSDIEIWNKDVIENSNYHLEEENSENEAQSDSDSELADTEEPTISHSEAVRAFDTAIRWAKQNEIDISDIIKLKTLQEKATVANLTKQKIQ